MRRARQLRSMPAAAGVRASWRFVDALIAPGAREKRGQERFYCCLIFIQTYRPLYCGSDSFTGDRVRFVIYY